MLGVEEEVAGRRHRIGGEEVVARLGEVVAGVGGCGGTCRGGGGVLGELAGVREVAGVGDGGLRRRWASGRSPA